MAASVLYCGAFDLDDYGSVTINWTDTGGPWSVTVSTGIFVHGSVGTTLGETAYADFIAYLVAAMDAATPRTVTGSFSETTGLVTLACTGGTFTISFVGAAGTRMKYLLGFHGTITGAATYTGSHHPLYVLKPYLPCVTAYTAPFKESGRSITKRTIDGTMYTLKPATIMRLASWRHDFEPKAMVDRDYFDGVALAAALNKYTWQDLWDDFGTHRLPIFAIWYSSDAVPVIEYLCFDLMVDDYEKSTHDRMSPRDDVRHKVMISASIRSRLLDS